jgi:DNA-binding MarR family transcriptional regulator
MDTSVFAPLYDLPAYLLRRAFQKAIALFDGEIGSFGITSPQLAVLNALQLCDGLQQREIGRAVGFDEATVGGIVARMVRQGLVERVRSSRSSRGWEVSLTAQGRALCQQVAPRMEQQQRLVLEPLTRAEQHELLRLLSKLNAVENSYWQAPAQTPAKRVPRRRHSA